MDCLLREPQLHVSERRGEGGTDEASGGNSGGLTDIVLLADPLSIVPHKCLRYTNQRNTTGPVRLQSLVPHPGSATKHVAKSCVTQLPDPNGKDIGLEIAKVL